MSLTTYLQAHFLPKDVFAAFCNVSEERLSHLIEVGAVPEPTYTCKEGTIRSAVFGSIPISENLAGEYFRAECARWARIADHASPGGERAAVVAVLLQEMEGYMAGVLGDASAAREKAELLLPHFFNGTFGLCIADPSTGAGIARKELLQDQLVELVSDERTPLEARVDKQALLALIDDYARASMPFSPAEYDRSSRKRLVDDLRRALCEKS
ncbi:DUF6058 family natural product biosynthesis protein [Stenotrophomonas maltophilia]|uniref:DUF6058 family natural product biosynthesis protein n=1 Tax=Stenotrophomonas maltophilia TaxID=40324 RepID=UPI002895B82E|nr:DUF6058 family natural product biosynthesis protein [Stenotrophomonas maltophilia]MDT3485899.1 DUF6058 family natural product biosynthesis protein [Stenotrophomonas maltophilia]